jgi:hypothetical protein
MKILYTFLIFSLSLIHSYGQTLGVSWSSPLNVGTGSLHNNIYPRITVTSNDVPLVVWEDNSPAKVYSSRKTGAAFSAPLSLNPTGISPFVANWAGAEVSSSGDTVFAVFTSMPVLSGNAYAVRSIDGGISYSDTVRIDQDSARIPSFPSVIVMPGGNPIVSYMIADDGSMLNTEYVVSKSTDGGTTFLPSVMPANTGNVCECCPASMAITGNDFALLYRNDISNLRNIWSSFSSDGGASFSMSAEIDTTDWYTSTCPSSGPSAVIIGDSLVYSWMSDATGDARIYIGTMNINDQLFGQQRQIYPAGTSTQNFPVIAGKGDTLGLVWQGYNGSFQDVLFSWSVTGVAGLGLKIDTLTKSTSGHQSRPDLTFNNGKFHLVYSDNVGTQVKYLEGDFAMNVSVNEINAVPDVSLTSMNINGSIEVQLNSTHESTAEILIVNAMGQQIQKTAIDINTGANHYSLQHSMSPGIYFILVEANDGKVYNNKVVVAK